MKKKVMKAIRDLNAYIDDDRQKLCDELHEIKLSHKRLEKLLRDSCLWIEGAAGLYDTEGYYTTRDEMLSFVSKVEKELSYPYFRANYKMKGGKNA